MNQIPKESLNANTRLVVYSFLDVMSILKTVSYFSKQEREFVGKLYRTQTKKGSLTINPSHENNPNLEQLDFSVKICSDLKLKIQDGMQHFTNYFLRELSRQNQTCGVIIQSEHSGLKIIKSVKYHDAIRDIKISFNQKSILEYAMTKFKNLESFSLDCQNQSCNSFDFGQTNLDKIKQICLLNIKNNLQPLGIEKFINIKDLKLSNCLYHYKSFGSLIHLEKYAIYNDINIGNYINDFNFPNSHKFEFQLLIPNLVLNFDDILESVQRVKIKSFSLDIKYLVQKAGQICPGQTQFDYKDCEFTQKQFCSTDKITLQFQIKNEKTHHQELIIKCNKIEITT